MKEQRVLAICGMHRSGTSLVTSNLEAAGLYIGEKLVGPTYGNPHGHFEDAAFVQLQEGILKANGISLHLASAEKEIKISSDQRRQAWKILSARSALGQWAWKDPRTSLMLDFWKTEIPPLRVCIIYRDYREVVDSLFRRARKQSAEGPRKWMVQVWHSSANFVLVNRHLSTWIAYNQRLLDFARSHPEDCCVIKLSDWTKQPDLLTDYLRENWGFHFTQPEVDRFDAKSLGEGAEISKLSFRPKLSEAADKLMFDLSKLALKQQPIY